MLSLPWLNLATFGLCLVLIFQAWRRAQPWSAALYAIVGLMALEFAASRMRLFDRTLLDDTGGILLICSLLCLWKSLREQFRPRANRSR